MAITDDAFELSLDEYFKKWKELCDGRTNSEFFAGLKPVAFGWKVASKEAYDSVYAELHDKCDRIIETWMNERWVAELHLKAISYAGGMSIVKLMQRRPGSDDAVGLDHVDFYSPAVKDAETILRQEDNLKWTRESNDVVKAYEWISVWFDGTEAKLKSDTVLDIVGAELQALNQQILAE